MRKFNHPSLIPFVIVIILTMFSGCALFSTQKNPNYEDPILREAMRVRDGWKSDGEMSSLSQEELRQQEAIQYRQEEDIQETPSSGEISVGMSMEQVVSAWGRPRDVETAGDPSVGNQKWIYLE